MKNDYLVSSLRFIQIHKTEIYEFNFLINYKGSISESENEYIGGVELFIAQSSSFVHREGSNL